MVTVKYTGSFGSRGSSASLASPLEQVNATIFPFHDTTPGDWQNQTSSILASMHPHTLSNLQCS